MNFSPVLRTAIAEARMLDRMGFEVPSNATSLALQETHYLAICEALTGMLSGYYQVLHPTS